MIEIKLDAIGRPVLEGRAAQYSACNKLLIAALRRGEPDDWDGPLGAVAEIAVRTDELGLLMSVAYVNALLTARECETMGIEGFTEEEVRREFGVI